jgi:hypothetical protein
MRLSVKSRREEGTGAGGGAVEYRYFDSLSMELYRYFDSLSMELFSADFGMFAKASDEA